jgi:hypothetical protein
MAARPMKKRGILLPAEHGAWGLIAEPLLLGMLVAPGLGGFGIAVFSFALFLLRTPGLRLLRARRAPAPDPHGEAVRRFSLICSGFALAGLLLALFTAKGAWVLPLLVSAPFAVWTLVEQDRGKTRTLWPELIASVAIGAPVTSIAVAGGVPPLSAWMLWLWLGLKSVTSILFVRNQIRRFMNRPHSVGGIILLYAGLSSLLLVLEAPTHVVVIFLLLSVRATVFSFMPVRSPKIVGWTEVAVSLLFVLGLGLGGG